MLPSVRTALAAACAFTLVSSAGATLISPLRGAQAIGSVIAGTTYAVSATGTINLCSTCNGGGALSFNPDGTVAATAKGGYAAFNNGPLDYDPSQAPGTYYYRGEGLGAGYYLGALYGSFSTTPTPGGLFSIGRSTTFTASTTGTLYGFISDSNYADNPVQPAFNVTLAAAVPEPAMWALMLAGFAFIGNALRSRPRAGLGLA